MFRSVSLAILCLACATALADEQSVRKALQEKFPKVTIDSVQKSGMADLYEVFMERQLIYTDEGAAHIFAGNIVETKTNRNVTDERLRKLSAIPFDTLPLDLAIKTVKGDGQRRIAVFSDPHCPYCQQLERELALVNDITIYTFLYPIESLHPGATDVAKKLWCTADRSKAWDEWMLRSKTPDAEGQCDNPVAALQDLARKYRIDGTPTMVFSDGTVMSGTLQLRQLEAALRIAQQP